jgi:hypothetical protein
LTARYGGSLIWLARASLYNERMKWWIVLLTLLGSWNLQAAAEDDLSRMQAVELSATIQESPPRITINWPARNDATGYRLAKKANGSWQVAANLAANATSWSDGNVAVGQRYEYWITKGTPYNYAGWGYIKAGIRAPALDTPGRVMVLTHESLAGALAGELNRLRQDLIAEGWQPIFQTVSGGATPPQVKNLIKSAFDADRGSFKGVLLLGHIAVPYSGAIMPDGHDNHKGAWPADIYYAEMDGAWTDSSVNIQTSERQINWNTPGDGKFDQGRLPSDADFPLGRVDLSELTCFSNKQPPRSELDLMRQYLNKNHEFRSGRLNFEKKAYLIDNFGLRETNGVSASGWRNFSTFVGAQNVELLPLNTYVSKLSSQSALFTWGAGGGSYYYCSGVADSDAFALNNLNVPFTLWLGSYFGDWNNESNFLRAALGSGSVLVSIYSGLPHSFLHGMGIGETVGEGMLLSQNNKEGDGYYPDGQGHYEAHQSLHGDPTLRLFPRAMASNVAAQGGAGQATVSWQPPAGALGAYVYRSSSPDGPWQRVTAEPVSGTSYVDRPTAGSYSYMVRPVFLEQTGSGSYLNPSKGAVTGNVSVTGGIQLGPITLSGNLSGPRTFTLMVFSTRGATVIIESSDLVGGWTEMTRASNQGQPLEYQVPVEGSARIWRARYQQ